MARKIRFPRWKLSKVRFTSPTSYRAELLAVAAKIRIEFCMALIPGGHGEAYRSDAYWAPGGKW